MDQSEHLLLVNNETKENHRLLESECVIGRGWLNVSTHFTPLRKCAINFSFMFFAVRRQTNIPKTRHTEINLKQFGIIDIGNLFMLFSAFIFSICFKFCVSLCYRQTHRNPIFYKTKNDEILQMTHEEGESFVLSPGDSFGLLSNAFWFEIVKSNMQSDIQKSADVSSIVKSSPNESAAAVPKRKLPAWMNGNSSKKLRSDDNAVNVPGDGDITVAMDENSTEPSNRVPSVVEQVGRDLVLKTPEMESVAKDFDLKRKLPATNDANDNKKMCSDDDGVTAPNDGNITAATDDKSTEMYNPGSAVQDLVLETPSKGSAVADDNETMSCNEASASSSGDNGSAATTIDANAATDNAESAVAEPDVQMDTSKHSDENESAELTNEIEPVSDDAIEVSCEPIEDSNASKSDEKAAEPMPNDGQDVPDAEVADDTPHVEPATSTAANIAADSDDEYDGVPLPKIVIKTEPIDDIEPNVSDNVAVAGPSGTVTIKQEIKTEVKTEPDSSTDSKEQKRDCCRYGVTCYR